MPVNPKFGALWAHWKRKEPTYFSIRVAPNLLLEYAGWNKKKYLSLLKEGPRTEELSAKAKALFPYASDKKGHLPKENKANAQQVQNLLVDLRNQRSPLWLMEVSAGKKPKAIEYKFLNEAKPYIDDYILPLESEAAARGIKVTVSKLLRPRLIHRTDRFLACVRPYLALANYPRKLSLKQRADIIEQLAKESGRGYLELGRAFKSTGLNSEWLLCQGLKYDTENKITSQYFQRVGDIKIGDRKITQKNLDAIQELTEKYGNNKVSSAFHARGLLMDSAIASGLGFNRRKNVIGEYEENIRKGTNKYDAVRTLFEKYGSAGVSRAFYSAKMNTEANIAEGFGFDKKHGISKKFNRLLAQGLTEEEALSKLIKRYSGTTIHRVFLANRKHQRQRKAAGVDFDMRHHLMQKFAKLLGTGKNEIEAVRELVVEHGAAKTELAFISVGKGGLANLASAIGADKKHGIVENIRKARITDRRIALRLIAENTGISKNTLRSTVLPYLTKIGMLTAEKPFTPRTRNFHKELENGLKEFGINKQCLRAVFDLVELDPKLKNVRWSPRRDEIIARTLGRPPGAIHAAYLDHLMKVGARMEARRKLAEEIRNKRNINLKPREK